MSCCIISHLVSSGPRNALNHVGKLVFERLMTTTMATRRKPLLYRSNAGAMGIRVLVAVIFFVSFVYFFSRGSGLSLESHYESENSKIARAA